MPKKHLFAGLVLAATLPSFAIAQESCEQRTQNRAAGTVAGALAGALLGGAVSNHSEKGAGALVGGIAGAVVGNQLAKGPEDCQHAYGWYDDGGRWHANGVNPDVASGYYDRGGRWVQGRPAEYVYQPPAYAPPPPPQRDEWNDRHFDDEFRGAPGYPQFRDQEEHIRFLIRDSVRDDLIERDDARDLLDRLREIRRDEAREYEMHGERLPPEDFARIRERLARLDRLVDQIRGEP